MRAGGRRHSKIFNIQTFLKPLKNKVVFLFFQKKNIKIFTLIHSDHGVMPIAT